MRDDVYSVESVERLLGLHEPDAGRGHRDITVADLLSWARDPGGDSTWRYLLESKVGIDVWMARRGPLDPASKLACILWDFMAAVKKLPLGHQAIVWLATVGFSATEIAEILDEDSLGHRRSDRRQIEAKRKRITRILDGQEKKDRDGNVVLDGEGNVVMVGGAVRKLARIMNGRR